MNALHTAELATACGEFGLNVEIVEPEDQSGPVLILTGGFPNKEVIRELNQRLFLIEPQIRKILLEIPHDEVSTD